MNNKSDDSDLQRTELMYRLARRATQGRTGFCLTEIPFNTVETSIQPMNEMERCMKRFPVSK
uniref:Uncharacterized protein n=1 Tax=Cucumis sativus TaxID=3659 RepID=A0A0A0KZS6_CUCSA